MSQEHSDTRPTIAVQVNGRALDVPSGLTVAGFLRFLELDSRMIVVEQNRVILKRGDHDRQTVREGDRYELVQFVGGG